MKRVLLCFVILINFNAYSGYLIGSDSVDKGVLKLTKLDHSVVQISKCSNSALTECSIIGIKEISVVDGIIDYTQIGASAFIQIAPSAFIGLAGALNFLYFQVIGGTVLTGMSSVYLKVMTNIKGLNLIRLKDFASINSEAFLNDETQFIVFPDDTIDAIFNEIL